MIIISTIVSGVHITCAEVICPGKSQGIYCRVFEMLKRLAVDHFGREPVWEFAMLDFELALGNALTSTFPHVKLLGCLFHYCQAVMRHAFGKCGLKALYFKNNDVKLFIRCLLALPYLKPNLIVGVRAEILQHFRVLHPNVLGLPGRQPHCTMRTPNSLNPKISNFYNLPAYRYREIGSLSSEPVDRKRGHVCHIHEQIN